MSNTSIEINITSQDIGDIHAPGFQLGTGTFNTTFTPTSNVSIDTNVSINGGSIDGLTDGVATDFFGKQYHSITFPSTMTKVRLTLPDLNVSTQSIFPEGFKDADYFAGSGVYQPGMMASVNVNFHLLVLAGFETFGARTELANVSYGTASYVVRDGNVLGGGGSGVFLDSPLSPATSTVDIDLGTKRTVIFQLKAHSPYQPGGGFIYGTNL